MKLSFSTENVPAASFQELCKIAGDYGFQGFEILDIASEKQNHRDSIFIGSKASDAKRKLHDRGLTISALTYPYPIDSRQADKDTLLSYVDLAFASGVEEVIISAKETGDPNTLLPLLAPALALAEKTRREILVETQGVFAHTENLLPLLNAARSSALGAAWNVRETFFTGGESAETTIKTLGAYIRYVRIGDRDAEGKDVLIGSGRLPVDNVLKALRSLNYEGFIAAAGNDEITNPDVVLTHFKAFMDHESDERKPRKLFSNRAGTGTFPWEKYKTVDHTFGQVLDILADTYPDQPAFRFTTLDYTRTYSEFREDVDRIAGALIALGVKPGYHVAIWATNIPAWFLTFWAATRIGAVLVTVNTAYKIHEAEYLLRQSDTHTLVMIGGYRDADYKGIIEELCPELTGHQKGTPLYAKNLPFLKNVVTVDFEMEGCYSFNDLFQLGMSVPKEEVRRRAAQVSPEDVCNMQYTSGTTGFPKGVMLTHRNIINDGKIIGDRMDLSTADRMMIQVPMFHCFGMVLSMTSMMTHGGTLSPIPYYSPKSALACITQERITCFNGVPTMFIAMFNHPDFAKTDFSHVRTGIMAGSNCPADLMRRAAKEMHMTEIVSVYGQTESSPGCTMGEVNESEDLRVETVGSAFPGVECRIIDPETGEELPDNENGEFVARGFNIMKGYYKMPEATAQTIDAEGWLHTGDICCRTPEGYYKVTGRLKDMIIRGGENIYPREIEEFYLTNPKVRDVQVIGVKDDRYGEEACAWIVLHENETATEAEMKDYGNRNMARHKVPRYFFFVSEFPMNAAGKILKYKMKEESEKRLGLAP